MKPAAFAYERPASLADALALIGVNPDGAKLIAGGQSLVPAMNFRLARPEMLVDIAGLPDLDVVHEDGGDLVIGALTRHARFHAPVCAGELGDLLSRVVRHIAHYPIRQRGTFGGSLCHADPAAEWCLVAATFDARMMIAGPSGTRVVAASDFFRGSFTTAVGPADILTEIRLPRLAPGWRTGFREFARRHGDFALAMSLAALEIKGGTICNARVGVGAVSDRPRRLEAVETLLIGRPPNQASFAAAGELGRDLVSPHGDIHGSAAYRRDLTAAMIERALADAAALAAS